MRLLCSVHLRAIAFLTVHLHENVGALPRLRGCALAVSFACASVAVVRFALCACATARARVFLLTRMPSRRALSETERAVS